MEEALLIPKVFLPKVIRRYVQPNLPGVYVLGNDEGGFIAKYVGRSDSCLRTRLMHHNYLYQYDYFIFLEVRGIKEAYYLECQLWHSVERKDVSNCIHPASPKESNFVCPYCQFSQQMVRFLA